jgi:hypothetical protein
MTDTSPDPFHRDNMPFVAPCRNLSTFAPFRWLRLGIADYRRAPQLSLVYGIFMAAIIAAVALLAWT